MSPLCIVSLTLLAGNLLGLSPLAGQTPKRDSSASHRKGSSFPSVNLTPREDSTLVAQLVAATHVAHQQGRTPVVEIGAPWCGPCHQLADILNGPEMHATMQHMYVISLNNDLWQQALVNLGFDASTGIPRVVVIDSTGRPVGEPWRPRDVPGTLSQKLGDKGAWRVTLEKLFVKAQQQWAIQSPPAGRAKTALRSPPGAEP